MYEGRVLSLNLPGFGLVGKFTLGKGETLEEALRNAVASTKNNELFHKAVLAKWAAQLNN